MYDGHAIDANLIRELVVVIPVYCLVGGVVVEARAAAGTQFDAGAIEALEALARRGELMPAAARMHQPAVVG